MTTDGFKRRLAVSIIVIWLAAAAAGAGTMAYFTDTEASENNYVGFGSLDLLVDGKNGEATTTLDTSGVEPGESGQASSTLRNNGELDGYLDVNLNEATDLKGENPESEPDTAEPGELGDELHVEIYLDDDGDLSTTSATTTEQTLVASGTVNEIQNATYDTDHPLNSGETTYLVVVWSLPTETGNDAQGDEVRVDISVQLEQIDEETDTDL